MVVLFEIMAFSPTLHVQVCHSILSRWFGLDLAATEVISHEVKVTEDSNVSYPLSAHVRLEDSLPLLSGE